MSAIQSVFLSEDWRWYCKDQTFTGIATFRNLKQITFVITLSLQHVARRFFLPGLKKTIKDEFKWFIGDADRIRFGMIDILDVDATGIYGLIFSRISRVENV